MTRRSRLIRSAPLLSLALLIGGAGLLPSGLAQGTNKPIRIGFVSPQTGPLASFGEADKFVLQGMAELMSKNLGGRKVEIIVKDSQSDPNRASSVAADLISKDKVDLILVSSTPATVNPVSDQCEANGVPCISTVAPWQAWYFRNPKVSAAGYQNTFHFFWGLEDIVNVFDATWKQVPTNKVIGALWASDPDGLAFAGQTAELKKRGYTVVDPGRFNEPTDDFTAQITAFKKANVQILTAMIIPPDLRTFMVQAKQQGFNPKIVTIAKAALYPSDVQSVGAGLGAGIGTEVWWTPSHPFKSSLSGASSAQFAASYEKGTGRQWTQTLGFVHALFEVATDALKRTPDASNHKAMRDAIKATKLSTLVGPVNWSTGPTPNVSKTPLVGGQWVKGSKYPFDLVITQPSSYPNIKATAKVVPTTWK
jgi:branched-chain amino acid transport system substrate-binding protein